MGFYKMSRVIGHRGAKMEAPENTLASVRRAKELGCTWVEVDVMLTKDKVPVIHHDNTLERCTNGQGNYFLNVLRGTTCSDSHLRPFLKVRLRTRNVWTT